MRVSSTLSAIAVSLGAAWAASAEDNASTAFPGWATDLARAACRSAEPSGAELARLAEAAGLTVAGVEAPATSPSTRDFALTLKGGETLRASFRRRGTAGEAMRLVLTGPRRAMTPDLLVQLDGDCRIRSARVAERDRSGRFARLVSYNGDPPVATGHEPLNPPVPPGADPGGVAIAAIDTGVVYTLPRFASRLARDGDGAILGHDFHDDDHRPFDFDPSRSPIFPIRHGTAVASILLREAPDARLIPLRYPAGAPQRFAAMVEHVAGTPARIVSMALGGAKRSEWEPFAEAAGRHPEILFVVSAGNDGRDIDAAPLYPAAFALDNMIVVTSTDAFGRLAPESNWGARTVDIAVPGERIDVIDHRGARGKASGTSYAVPRVAALAARLMARHPDWDATRLKAEILALAAPLDDPARPVAAGWIPNPAIE